MSKIVRVVNSLQTQLILSFVALIVVIAGGTYVYTYDQTRQALWNGARDDLRQIIGIASTQFSADEIAEIQGFKVGDDATPGYQAMVTKLRTMRSVSPNVSNFYIMQIRDGKVVFLVDDAEDDPASVGDLYDEAEPVLYEAKTGIQVSPSLYQDKWGRFLSAYAPIKGTSGDSTLIIGADILAQTVYDRENFIGATIYLVMGIAVLIAAALIGLFSVTIIRDIKKLNRVAEQISTGDTNVQVDVHRRDEIGELAKSFGRMVASLKIMMDVDEKPEQTQPKGQ